MKKSAIKFALLAFVFGLFLTSCGGSKLGKKVKEPFSSSKYQTNNRYFRATGNAKSRSMQVAKSKAMTVAKTNLAGMVKSNMRRVADVYLSETGNGDASNLGEKFESLSREIVNQDIADLRMIGDETRINEDGQYTTYIALEAKKRSMYRWLKKFIRLDNKTNASTKRQMEEIIDKEIKRLEQLDAEAANKNVD